MEKELLTLEDALNYTSAAIETASAEGTSLIYRTHEPDPAHNGWIHKIILNQAGPEKTGPEKTGPEKSLDEQITGSPVFVSEDTFVATVKESEICYKLVRFEKDSREILGEVPCNLAVVAVIDENRLILKGDVDLVVSRAVAAGQELAQAYEERRIQDEDCIIADEFPYWTNNVGATNKHRQLVFVYDKEAGLKPVTEDIFNTQAFAYDKKHQRICLTGGAYVVEKPLKNECRLICVEDVLKADKVPAYKQLFVKENWVPTQLGFGDGKLYFAHKDTASGMTAIAVYDPETESCKDLTLFEESMGYSLMTDIVVGGGKDWQVTDEGVYFLATWQDHCDLYYVDTEGKKTRLTGSEGAVNNFHVSRKYIYVTALHGLDHQELFRQDRKTGTWSCMSNLNASRYANKQIQPMEKYDWTDANGFEIYGYVIRPVGFEAGKQYPAILDIHGGPAASYGPIYCHEMQYWAAKGYFVVLANPTGGTGRGPKFGKIIGGTGRADYDDIMGWLDMILEKIPEIDPKHLGVTGGSYGGFMTNWILGHTDRFAAAASQRSTANNITESATKDFANRFIRIYTQPDDPDRFEKLWELSPLKYIDKSITKTPTLFIHGLKDYTCYHIEALQMYAALQYCGVPAKMVLFKDEAHGLSRAGKPRNRLRRLNEITCWMDKYLKG